METARTILAIETSCDETSVAVLKRTDLDTGARYEVLSHVTLSQIELHIPYGGVYPNLARREHEANITHVIAEALTKAGLSHLTPNPSPVRRGEIEQILSREEILLPIISDFLERHVKPAIDAIAVTVGPGLEPALWVGINTARVLSTAWNLPVIPVNHMEGHIYSCWMNAHPQTPSERGGAEPVVQDTNIFYAPDAPLPSLALLISGGHTEFISVQNWGEYEYFGGTIDDAIGEAFDKSARLLGLAYPGGPKVSKFAAEFEATGNKLDTKYELPRPMISSGDLRMSFSGLKTAVRYLVERLKKDSLSSPQTGGDASRSGTESDGGGLTDYDISSICYSFETAVVDVLIKKTKLALDQTCAQSLMIGGGVAANRRIRSALQTLCDEYQIPLLLPTSELSTDNALMIALAGIHKTPTNDLSVLVANGNMQF